MGYIYFIYLKKEFMIEIELSEEENSKIRLNARKQNKYFTKVYLSVTAAAKMLSHGCYGQPK